MACNIWLNMFLLSLHDQVKRTRSGTCLSWFVTKYLIDGRGLDLWRLSNQSNLYSLRSMNVQECLWGLFTSTDLWWGANRFTGYISYINTNGPLISGSFTIPPVLSPPSATQVSLNKDLTGWPVRVAVVTLPGFPQHCDIHRRPPPRQQNGRGCPDSFLPVARLQTLCPGDLGLCGRPAQCW